MSDRVPNCFMQSLERLGWFDFTVNSKFIRRHFGTSSIRLTAEFFQEAYPAIRERFGRDQELDLEIKIKNPRFAFGTTDSNVAYSCSITMGIKLEDGFNYLVYDELEFYTEFDMTIDQEILYGSINQMKWGKGGSIKQRTTPSWDDLQINPAEYEQFWEWMNAKSNKMYRWLNDQVLEQGV